MGIRYFAYAIDEDDAPAAAASPRDLVLSEKWEEHWLECGDRDTLDLDRAWGYLQRVLSAEDGESRPAYELVRGDVSLYPCGWKPFRRYLTPDAVAAVAADLEDIDDCMVMEALAAHRTLPDDRYAEDVQFTLHYLERAAEFTAKLARERRGLIYVIG